MKYDREYKKKTEVHFGKEMEVWYAKGLPGLTLEEMEEAKARGENIRQYRYCPKLNPTTYEPEPGITCHRVMAVKMRDGVTIYFDLYLPTWNDQNNIAVPVIISWSMFGKRQSEGAGEWKLMGVPPGTVTKMCKFESADPGFWCRNGYAIANVDQRGCGNSEGECSMFGENDARDGYDFVEWCAQQPWCTGRVGFFGNSGVGMPLWRIASLQPPHLACIAPWEATVDMYRESLKVGGVSSGGFNSRLIDGIGCQTWIEDMDANMEDRPFYDEYWQNKAVDFKKVVCPAYVAAGWCHFHLHGSIEGFRRIRSPKKWLRIHREFEWPDSYHYENLADLMRFFDRYLKDIHNGWEFTPRVRVDVMDAYDFDLCPRRPEEAFPLKRTEYKKLYLDAKSAAAEYHPFEQESELSYDTSDELATVTFDHVFREDTEITGYMKLRLWVECRGHDDMDLFIWIKKLGTDGQYIPVHCMKEAYRGAWGYMRVSARELDENLATDFQPIQAHKRALKLSPGEIVPVDIEIWPHSRFWHAGEALRIEVGGSFIRTEWYEDAKMGFATDNNNAIHVIHTGGKYDSFLQIPVIPPKYQVNDYIVR